MKNRIQDIFDKSMAIESFTHTSSERNIENFLNHYIGSLLYFQEHSDYFGTYQIPDDIYQRSVNWALVKGHCADTVILFHHHDTVDIEDFGNLKEFAFDNVALKKALASASLGQDVLDDIISNEWQFGRGSCDMKAALALQLGVVAEYASKAEEEVNLLYLSVGDEESYSQGMRAAVGLLANLKKKFHLNYILAIDSEPFESPSAQEKVLHVGTVGKMMLVVVTQGILSHMKEPLKGINAVSLLAKVVEKIDLNPLLSDSIYGEQAPLPSWSYMRDLKENYDVSTVLRAAGYFSVLYLDKSPKELMTTIQQLCQEAIDEFYERYQALQVTYKEDKKVTKPHVLTYEELIQLCQKKAGFEEFMQKVNQSSHEAFQAGSSYQEITIATVQKVLDFYDKKEAFVVLAIAPPYYPSMNCRHLKNSVVDIEKLIAFYRDYLVEQGASRLKVEEFFMGICDISYCALEKSVEEYQKIIESMAVPKHLYSIDFEKIQDINVPGINLGPWGKDLHQLTERVYEKDMLETIPQFLLYLLEHIDSIKK